MMTTKRKFHKIPVGTYFRFQAATGDNVFAGVQKKTHWDSFLAAGTWDPLDFRSTRLSGDQVEKVVVLVDLKRMSTWQEGEG